MDDTHVGRMRVCKRCIGQSASRTRSRGGMFSAVLLTASTTADTMQVVSRLNSTSSSEYVNGSSPNGSAMIRSYRLASEQ